MSTPYSDEDPTTNNSTTPNPNEEGLPPLAIGALISIGLAVLLFVQGMSQRGVVKEIERDMVKNETTPGEWAFVGYNFLNACAMGLPGIFWDVTLDDPISAYFHPSKVAKNALISGFPTRK